MESLADRLVEAFDEGAKALEGYEELLSSTLDEIIMNHHTQALGKSIHILEKMVDASFLTRWYWEWRFEKQKKVVEKTKNLVGDWNAWKVKYNEEKDD